MVMKDNERYRTINSMDTKDGNRIALSNDLWFLKLNYTDLTNKNFLLNFP